MPSIYSKLIKPKPTEVYSTYWKFAVERQRVFFNKLHKVFPLTSDPVLIKHKFTNAYRVTDRVSQYLIKEVIYSAQYSNLDLFYRIILFKIFNKIETWKYLENSVGPLLWSNYSFDRISEALEEQMNLKKSVYSGAYIMASGKSHFGFRRKHQNHLSLIEMLIQDRIPEKISKASSLEDVYILLKGYPSLGKFLAFQYTIDLNYSELINFSEMDHVIAGPGARDGISKCFKSIGELSEEDLIRWVTDRQEEEFESRGLDFQNLWGRRLQLIDCQNLFCEVDKYARVVHPDVNGKSTRSRIKQKYAPNREKIEKYMLPPKWGIAQN